MKNEFDNNLTDKGWASMRRLLDREMPEQHRRRRFVWWLFGLLLLPLAGLGSWWLWQQSGPVPAVAPPTEAPKESEPVVRTENTPLSPDESGFPLHLESSSGFNNVGGQNLKSHASALGENTKRGEEWAAKPENRATDIDLSANINSVQVPDPVRASSSNVSEAPALAPDAASENPTVTTQLVLYEPVLDIEKFEPLALLPARQVTVVKAKRVEIPFTGEAIIKKKENNTRWSFGLAAGLATEQFSSLNGFSAGGAVDWQFHRKWGLRSGLQFAQYRLSAEERPVVSLTSLEYADATGNLILNTGGGSYPNPNQDSSTTVLVPVERLRQLEMPLMAYWQPAKFLRVFGGISTAYTLSAKASEQNYANNQVYYAYDKSAQDNLNELTSSTLSRWQVNWQAGVGFRLGRHLELGAFYKNGFGGSGNYDSGTLNDPSQFNGASSSHNTGTSHYFLLNGIWFF